MQVFNTYFRLLNRKKGMILTYIGIFLGIAVSFTIFSGQGDISEQYQRQSVNIAVAHK